MSTSTLTQILEIMVDEYGFGVHGTNSGTALTSLTDDTILGGPDAAKDLGSGCQVLITLSNDNAAPEGEITQLSTKPKLNSGLANLDPALTAALDAAGTYVILYRPFRFLGRGLGLVSAINEAHNQFPFIKRTLPYTLVPDGDMTGSGVGDWTIATGAVAKVDATFAKPERNIKVTDSGAGAEFVYPAVNLFVEEGKSYYLEVTGWGEDAADSGTLEVKDVTNSSAAITLSETVIDRMEPEILRNTFTPPSGCKEIQIRLVCDAASDILHWTNLQFRKSEQHEYILPDTPASPVTMGRLGYYEGQDWSARGEFIALDSVRPEQLSAGLWRYRTDINLSSKSLWYERFEQPTDLAVTTVSTASTPVPARALAAMAAEKVLFPVRFKSKEWGARYQDAQRKAARVVDDYVTLNQVTFKDVAQDYPVPAF